MTAIGRRVALRHIKREIHDSRLFCRLRPVKLLVHDCSSAVSLDTMDRRLWEISEAAVKAHDRLLSIRGRRTLLVANHDDPHLAGRGALQELHSPLLPGLNQRDTLDALMQCAPALHR